MGPASIERQWLSADYFQGFLGVERGADARRSSVSFRKLARQFIPDVIPMTVLSLSLCLYHSKRSARPRSALRSGEGDANTSSSASLEPDGVAVLAAAAPRLRSLLSISGVTATSTIFIQRPASAASVGSSGQCRLLRLRRAASAFSGGFPERIPSGFGVGARAGTAHPRPTWVCRSHVSTSASPRPQTAVSVCSGGGGNNKWKGAGAGARLPAG